MKFPCELLAEPYLAQLRIQVAHRLHDEGYSQTEIAELLQVSQPVVSGYLRRSLYREDLPEELVFKANEVGEKIAGMLSSGPQHTMEAMELACHECKIMRQYGPTCDYHRAYTSDLSIDCNACHTKSTLLSLQQNKQGVLTDLNKLYNSIIDNILLDQFIPEIGLQIIHSVDNPQSMSDIAAFPGRIIKRKGRQPIAETPIFGGSETTSQLLLNLTNKGLQIRTIAAMKTSDELTNLIKKHGLTYFVVQGLEEDIFAKIEEMEFPNADFVIIGEDSVGFESITYVCCENIDPLMIMMNLILN